MKCFNHLKEFRTFSCPEEIAVILKYTECYEKKKLIILSKESFIQNS